MEGNSALVKALSRRAHLIGSVLSPVVERWGEYTAKEKLLPEVFDNPTGPAIEWRRPGDDNALLVLEDISLVARPRGAGEDYDHHIVIGHYGGREWVRGEFVQFPTYRDLIRVVSGKGTDRDDCREFFSRSPVPANILRQLRRPLVIREPST